MLLKSISLAALALVGALGQAVAGNAGATEYHCKISKQNSGTDTSALPPVLTVWHDETSGEVKVQDSLIKAIYGGPIAGKVSVDNAKRTTFSYKLKNMKGKNQHGAPVLATALSFRLTIQKSDRSAVLAMKPLGFSNTFRSTGQCQVK